MMNFPTQHTSLIDCRQHGEGSELIIVEGESASKAVARVRDAQFQAVLPMQGKPMNATKSSHESVRKNIWYRALVDALGVGWSSAGSSAGSPTQMRYDRVLLLFDPDADGIHCGALVLLFFDKYLPALLGANRLSLIKAPMFEIRAAGYPDSILAYSEEHLQKLRKALDDKKIYHQHQRYRGLASLNDDVLLEACLDPTSRTAYLLQKSDADAARAIFGGRER